MWKAAFGLAFLAVNGIAQSNAVPSSEKGKNGSIGGIVKDETTGTPIADVLVSVLTGVRYSNGTVFTSSETKEVKAYSDAQGHYLLGDLPAGPYRVTARSKSLLGPRGEKMVNLRTGQDLTTLNFLFPVYGTITGRVLDQNKEPVPNASVYLLWKEYAYGGTVRYFYKHVANTDDYGEYTMGNVEPGIQNFLMAIKPAKLLSAISEAPLNPKLRKPAFVPTYYPNVEQADGAAAIVLFGGERREGVDFRLLREPSYCIEGAVASSGEGLMGRLTIAGEEFNPGIASGGGIASFEPSAPLSSDGKLRICGLHRGTYRLTAVFSQQGGQTGPSQYGIALANIVDEDVKDVRIVPSSGMAIPGAIAWETTPPDQPLTSKVSIYLQALSRGNIGERGGIVRSDVPGEFVIPNIFEDDYRLTMNVNVPGVYVKGILYGPSSILDGPMRAGSAPALRIALAHDGGSIAVKVADKDGNALPDIHVAILPAELQSEAALPGKMISGETDQDGSYSHGVLAPGKYLVLATTMKIDRTVDRVHRLWLARGQGKIIDLPPNGNAQVAIEPTKIE